MDNFFGLMDKNIIELLFTGQKIPVKEKWIEWEKCYTAMCLITPEC